MVFQGTFRINQGTSRIAAIDALRGFALLGILVVNIAFLASGYRMAGLAEPGFDGAADWAVRWGVTLLVENKFYLLFSFLFGYSLTLQIGSAAGRGLAFTPMFLRRLAGLFLIGAAHAVLLFPGDILTTYAVVGVALLLLRRIRIRTALALSAALTGLLALGFLALAWLAAHGVDLPGVAEHPPAQASEVDRSLSGSAAQIVGEHLRELSVIVVRRVLFQAPAVLAACLLGLAAGRAGLLAGSGPRTATLRRVQWIGFPVGLAGALVAAMSVWDGPVHRFAGEAATLLTAPLLAAAYGATLLRLLPLLPRLGRALAWAGRMALTNYLAQSLVCSLIFTGYGLALVDRVGPPLQVAIAAAVFAAQVVVSRRWLRAHRYGPAEWLLRRLTYGGAGVRSRPGRSTGSRTV